MQTIGTKIIEHLGDTPTCVLITEQFPHTVSTQDCGETVYNHCGAIIRKVYLIWKEMTRKGMINKKKTKRIHASSSTTLLFCAIVKTTRKKTHKTNYLVHIQSYRQNYKDFVKFVRPSNWCSLVEAEERQLLFLLDFTLQSSWWLQRGIVWCKNLFIF